MSDVLSSWLPNTEQWSHKAKEEIRSISLEIRRRRKACGFPGEVLRREPLKVLSMVCYSAKSKLETMKSNHSQPMGLQAPSFSESWSMRKVSHTARGHRKGAAEHLMPQCVQGTGGAQCRTTSNLPLPLGRQAESPPTGLLPFGSTFSYKFNVSSSCKPTPWRAQIFCLLISI